MNLRRKNGFTLTELLGVIVILALVAVIVIPVMGSLLNSTSKATFRESVNNIIESADNYLNVHKTIKYTGPVEYPIIFVCDGDNCRNDLGEKLDFERSVPISGKVVIAADGTIASMIYNGTYCAYGKKLNLEISSKCNVLDHTAPLVNDDVEPIITPTTNSIIVTIPDGLMHDDETGIQEYKIELYKDNVKLDEAMYIDSSISFTNLTSKTQYKVVITGINGNNLTAVTERNVWTHELLNPVIAYENTPKNPANGYFKKQVLKVTFDGTNIANPTYYIKSTRNGITSVNTIDSCGTGDKPGTCTTTSTKNISANIWYRVSGNIDVTYDTTATTEATIYAISYDGLNYSGASTKQVSKIDADKPTVTLGTAASKTNSITLNYTLADTHSGVESYTCKYSNVSGNYSYTGVATETGCTLSSLANNTTYYYQVCVTDGVGNTGDCKTGSYSTKDFTNPTMAYTNTPSEAVNGYLKSQTVHITYSNSNVDNATYYIKTTRDGVASANTVSSCGIGDNPGTCTATTTKNLTANIWYKVSGNINVTYSSTAVDTATIYALTYDGNNFSGATTKTVSMIDATKPTVTLGTVTKKTNSITIPYTLADGHSGIGSYTCKYSSTSGSYTTNGNAISDSSCTLTGLDNTKTYYYQICVTDGVGNVSDCKTGSSKPDEVPIPTMAYTNTPTTPINDYYKTQVVNITYSNTNVDNATYYIKTTRAGTASANTVASCGTDTNPGTCTDAATKSLAANTWYKVSGNINVTYNATNTSEATIYTVTYDGVNFSASASKTISKIDAEKPTVTLGTVTKSSNSITIPYTLADAKTGIGSYTCKYSDTNGSYTTNGNTVTTTSCTITGLSNKKTYYYQVCVTDGVGNTGDCKTGSTNPAEVPTPTITYTNTPSTAVNGYLKSQVANISFTNTNVNDATYYIKTTRAASASANTVSSCGTGTDPGSCTSATTKSLAANTWYKVSGNINVTYNATNTSEATIYAVTYDGVNFSTSASKSISKIDADQPTVTIGTVTTRTNSIEIPYTLADTHSGIKSYTCKYSDTSGSYTTNGNTITSSKCTITGLTNKTYYYQVCATDNVENTTVCKTGTSTPPVVPQPTITYTNTPSTGAVNGYLKSQVANITFSSTNVTSAQYFIKTTRAATASANIVASCGTDTNPGTCTSATTKSLAANTWYKVSGNINVTYNATNTSEATIYAITYDGNNFSASTSKSISKIDADKPTVTLSTATVKTNSIEIPYTLADTHSGIKSYTCKYSDTSGSYTTNGNTVTSSKCTITGLTNKTYYYQVCVTDGVGNAGDCKTGSSTPPAVPKPTIAYENTPSAAVSGYFKSQVLKVTFSNTSVSSAQYYIRTTRAGTASAKTVQVCGTGDKPASCSNSAVTALEANKWYKVSGSINVTYNATATTEATITALTYDGNNYSESTSKTVSKIDAEKPTITLGTVTTKTNSITIPYTLADAKTGIGSYTCKYSATSGSYTTNGSATSTSCTLSGLAKNTTYYYQICVKDGVGNDGDCKTGSKATANIVNPTCTYANTPASEVNGYLEKQIIKCTFDGTNISSPQYFIRTTRAGTASAKTTQACGTGDKPASCSNSAVTALVANTWYKVSGNINVTYDKDATSTGTLTALTYDGNNYSGSTDKTIAKIEVTTPTAPTITGGTGTSWVKAAPTIKVSTAGSATSGVETYQYYKSTSSTAPTSSTTPTGTTSGDLKVTDEGTRYIWYRTKSKAGHVSAWTSAQQVNLDTNNYTVVYDYNYLPNNIFKESYNTKTFNSCCTSGATVTANGITYDDYGKIYYQTGQNGWYFGGTPANPLTKGTTYTIQYEAKASTSLTASIGSEQGVRSSVSIGTGWKRYTVTAAVATNDSYSAFVFYSWQKSGEDRSLYIRNLQIQEGNLNTSSVTKTIDQTLGTLPTASRTGYTFEGWYTDPTGGSKVATTTAIPYSASSKVFNLYARWKPNNYTITLNNQSATSAGTTSVTEKYEAGYNVASITVPTKTGHTFGGYYTATNGGGTQIIDSAGKIVATDTQFSANTTIYAKWIVNNYTVTCEDWFVDASNNRKTKLGSGTKSYAYGSSVSGTAWGSDTATSKYYSSYAYRSATSGTVPANNNLVVYRYFYAWTDLNIYYASGSSQSGATVSFKVGSGSWTDVTNESNTIQPWGTTYYLKNIRPKNSYEEFDRVTNLTWDSAGYYTYTPTTAGTSMNVYLKYKNYTVTYEDWFVDGSNNRKTKLGSSTASVVYGTTVNGSDKGTSTSLSAYYTNYQYKSSTSATVGTSGATVYRYFWAWNNINVKGPNGSEYTNGSVAKFSVSYNGASYVTGQSNETQASIILPYGATIKIKDITPQQTYYVLNNVTWDGTALTASSGVYTATVTSAGKDLNINVAYQKYYLDLNGWLDGASNGGISGYGTADVYINGTQVANDVADYYTQWPYGSTYEIKDIKAASGHTYNGVHSGSLTGTIGAGNVGVSLDFSTNSYTVTCEDWFVDGSNNRKTKLGSGTKSYKYGTSVSGTAWGTSGGVNDYYSYYAYKTATSGTVPANNNLVVYRYFHAWTDLNIFYVNGSQGGATVSFKVGNGSWTDVTNESNTVQPWGTTYYIKDIRPINSNETLDRVENLTWNSAGYYTYTPTTAGTSMNIYLKIKSYAATETTYGASKACSNGRTLSNGNCTYYYSSNATQCGTDKCNCTCNSWTCIDYGKLRCEAGVNNGECFWDPNWCNTNACNDESCSQCPKSCTKTENQYRYYTCNGSDVLTNQTCHHYTCNGSDRLEGTTCYPN